MSLSGMNHGGAPQGPPGLFLESDVAGLLGGEPAFNIVMITLGEVVCRVWIRPCMRKLFLHHVGMNKLYVIRQQCEARPRKLITAERYSVPLNSCSVLLELFRTASLPRHLQRVTIPGVSFLQRLRSLNLQAAGNAPDLLHRLLFIINCLCLCTSIN